MNQSKLWSDNSPYYYYNRNYIKILESDWSSAGLIWAVIAQLYASCLSNWTVHVIKLALVALEWVVFQHLAEKLNLSTCQIVYITAVISNFGIFEITRLITPWIGVYIISLSMVHWIGEAMLASDNIHVFLFCQIC